MALINPKTGIIKSAKVYEKVARLDYFIEYINSSIPNGYIVVAASGKGGISNHFMSKTVKDWFISMGSEQI